MPEQISQDTLQAFIRDLASHGQRTAVLQIRPSGAERVSFAELLRLSNALAAGLLAQGLAAGDRVALLAPNSVEWIMACLALLDAGLIPVPVDHQTGDEDLRHIIADSGVASVFTTLRGAERLRRCGIERRIVLLDRPGGQGRFWRELLAEGTQRQARIEPQDCAVLFYTSGTSGPPKGVPLSHANLLSNLIALARLDLVRPEDRLLLPLPLHHVYPFVVGLLTPLSMGISVVIPRSLVGAHFLAALRDGEVTILLGVPRLYAALVDAIERAAAGRGRVLRLAFRAAVRFAIVTRRALGLDSGRWLFTGLRRRIAPDLRLLISGGAPLERGLAERLEALGWPVTSGYGLTETAPILTFNLSGDCPVDSAGRPLAGVQIRIAEPAPGCRHGEVQAKGPNVFAGYRNLPDRTRQSFTADGWFRTGDLGYFDRSGALRLVGRASSMIVLPGGENIVPENLEERLERSPAIAEVGVLVHGGRLAGVVVPDRTIGRNLGPQELERRIREEIAMLSRSLPSYQRLGNIAIDASALPRTRLGKIRRHKLAERYAELTGERPRGMEPAATPELAPEDSELLDDPVAQQVWEWIGERFAGRIVSPDTQLRMDLAVDSLEWLTLTLEIRNRIGIELGDEAVARIETVRDLLRECASAEHALGHAEDAVTLLRDPDALLHERDRARFDEHPWRTRALDAAAVLLARLLLFGLFRFRVYGEERLPGAGPFLIASNHCSALDPIAIAAALGARRLHATFWGGWVGILFRSRLASIFSYSMRVLPVEPRSGPLSNLALAAAALHRGRNLVWFPEGMRSRNGKLQHFRAGVGLVLLAVPVPVIPVWIEGSRSALPPGSLRPRPTVVSLHFGPPASATELEAEGRGDKPEERIANALFARVQALREAAVLARASGRD